MSMTPEKLKNLFLDLGKPTLRGVRKCPKCGTLNGTRGISCKNKTCDVIFKEREKKKGHSADAVKVVTGSSVQIFSVRLRDRGPDYRGFVQLPLVQDMDGNPAENVDLTVLAQASRCYVDSCTLPNQLEPCSHIRAAVACTQIATPLTLKNSVFNSLAMSEEMKQAFWLLATETAGPLVQRVTKNMMVVKCKTSNKHPLGFLHVAFFESARNRQPAEQKFQCSCKTVKHQGRGSNPYLKEVSQKRCVHYYSCVCAFASDDKLAMEFTPHIQSILSPEYTLKQEVPVEASTSDTDEIEDEIHTEEVEVNLAGDISAVASVDDVAMTTTEYEVGADPVVGEPESLEVMIIQNEDMLSLSPAKRVRSDEEEEVADLLLADTQEASSALLTLQDTAVTQYTVPPKKPGQVKTPTNTRVPAPAAKKPVSVQDESSVSLTFHQWLSSVTERINQTMHYQFDGNPEPLVFHAPQKFFDCVQHRISTGNKKRRLPNATTGFVRKEALPLGTFTKYTWHITNILHVKQIFDTPEVSLDITRSFVENRDGTFDGYEAPPTSSLEYKVDGTKNKTPIRPFELKTYLKVGNTCPDQKDPTPFIIEWIPDILPRLHIGELRIRFEYGHQRNGHIERRIGGTIVSSENVH